MVDEIELKLDEKSYNNGSFERQALLIRVILKIKKLKDNLTKSV